MDTNLYFAFPVPWCRYQYLCAPHTLTHTHLHRCWCTPWCSSWRTLRVKQPNRTHRTWPRVERCRQFTPHCMGSQPCMRASRFQYYVHAGVHESPKDAHAEFNAPSVAHALLVHVHVWNNNRPLVITSRCPWHFYILSGSRHLGGPKFCSIQHILEALSVHDYVTWRRVCAR